MVRRAPLRLSLISAPGTTVPVHDQGVVRCAAPAPDKAETVALPRKAESIIIR